MEFENNAGFASRPARFAFFRINYGVVLTYSFGII
jgi:hypothetical protein